MSKRAAAVVSLVVTALAAACSSPPEETAARLDESLRKGTPTSRAVVGVTVFALDAGGTPSATVYSECSGTSLSDHWVLTSSTCGFDVAHPQAVQVCTSSHHCSGVARILTSPSPALYGALVELGTALPHAPYPTIADARLTVGEAVTCASGAFARSDVLPTEGAFRVDAILNGTTGWATVLPTGVTLAGPGDMGLACFQGTSIVAVAGKYGSSGATVADASLFASWVAAVVPPCGPAVCDFASTCGPVVDGCGVTIACGTPKCACEASGGIWVAAHCRTCSTLACQCTRDGGYWNGSTCS